MVFGGCFCPHFQPCGYDAITFVCLWWLSILVFFPSLSNTLCFCLFNRTHYAQPTFHEQTNMNMSTSFLFCNCIKITFVVIIVSINLVHWRITCMIYRYAAIQFDAQCLMEFKCFVYKSNKSIFCEPEENIVPVLSLRKSVR